MEPAEDEFDATLTGRAEHLRYGVGSRGYVMGGRRGVLGRLICAVAVFGLMIGMVVACSSSGSKSGTAGSGRVLLVGTFNGHAGQYKTIQAAVDAARSGDWILVAPGDYHEAADHQKIPTNTEAGGFGAVLIT
ncbi:MAG: hypothetical protein ABI276_02650 [Acidimicrobiales bacterium]